MIQNPYTQKNCSTHVIFTSWQSISFKPYKQKKYSRFTDTRTKENKIEWMNEWKAVNGKERFF